MQIDKMERVVELLNELVVDFVVSTEKITDVAHELSEIYSEKSFRHSYAELSDGMGKLQPDQRDFLCLLVDQMLGIVSKEKGEQDDTTIKMGKLCDHINLECLRISRIARVEFIGEQSTKELTEAGNSLKQTRGLVQELGNDVKGFHSQSITILGIFAGLVITFASVTQFTIAGISNLTNINANKIILFLSVSFWFLFNIIFFMMYSVAKISGKSIASRCESIRCSSCNGCKSSLVRAFKKYPYVVLFNLVAIIICIICFCLN